MKVLILHRRLSGYFIASLKQLLVNPSVEAAILAWPNQKDAPFDEALFADLGEVRNREEYSDTELLAAADAFQPDAVLVSLRFSALN